MSSMEQVIKEKTDETVNKMKEKLKLNGHIMNDFEEMIFRSGVSHGILISGLALVNTPSDIVSKNIGEKDNEL